MFNVRDNIRVPPYAVGYPNGMDLCIGMLMYMYLYMYLCVWDHFRRNAQIEYSSTW